MQHNRNEFDRTQSIPPKPKDPLSISIFKWAAATLLILSVSAMILAFAYLMWRMARTYF